MATAYEWTTYDYASRNVLGDLISKTGYSYRQFEETAGGEMKYSRVRDIALGRRAPVKLSEFLLICDVCHADPVETLREIIREAERIQHERLKPKPIPSVPDEEDIDSERSPESDEEVTRRALSNIMDLAAKHGDTEAEQEAYEELP